MLPMTWGTIALLGFAWTSYLFGMVWGLAFASVAILLALPLAYYDIYVRD